MMLFSAAIWGRRKFEAGFGKGAGNVRLVHRPGSRNLVQGDAGSEFVGTNLLTLVRAERSGNTLLATGVDAGGVAVRLRSVHPPDFLGLAASLAF